jgi:CRISPR-associated protein Cas1
MRDLHILPKVRDSWSYLYAERCVVEQDDKAIALFDQEGKTSVPCASLSLLMLGPGTKITHAAIRTLAESGCLVAWTGEQAVRFYALGMGETRSSANLLRQALLHADAVQRIRVVRRMYELRFPDPLDPALTLQQIRGKEGIRVRETYARWSRETGVKWDGRAYKQSDWKRATPINRALSAANSCLYGVVHAAIVAAGYSPALGFIHTGKMLSFVYDVADLYKAEITIPAAFRCTAAGESKLESRVRHICRDLIREQRMLMRIIEDLEKLFDVGGPGVDPEAEHLDRFDARPGGLWDPEDGQVDGGVNYGDEEEAL